MNGFDWNNNGKRDSFDAFMDMEIMNETGKSSSEKKFIQRCFYQKDSL